MLINLFFPISVLFLFFHLSYQITIYQCSRYSLNLNQCLNEWIDSYGNTRIDLRTCGTNQYCQTLSRKYDEASIGVCSYNFKRLFHGDKCSHSSECASMNCKKSKCIGVEYNKYCSPGRFQCENNLVCKKHTEKYAYENIRDVYRCSNLSQIGEICESNYECDEKLVCDSNFKIDNINNYDLNSFKNNISTFLNESKCVRRASLENGVVTREPMACKSGDVINYELFEGYKEILCVSKTKVIKQCDSNNKCVVEVDLGNIGTKQVEQDCIYTTKGNPFCPLNEKEMVWKEYLEKYNSFYDSADAKKMRKDEIYHIPVYKDNFNNLDVAKYFWRYQDWEHTLEADVCTESYFFLNNNGEYLFFPIIFYILVIGILFN